MAKTDTSLLSICQEYEQCAEAINNIEFNMIERYLEMIVSLSQLQNTNNSAAAVASQTVDDLKASAKATISEITKNLNAKMANTSTGNGTKNTATQNDEAILTQAVTTNLVAMIYAQDASIQQSHTLMTAALTQALSKFLSTDAAS